MNRRNFEPTWQRLLQASFFILLICWQTNSYAQAVKIIEVNKSTRQQGFGSDSKTIDTLKLNLELDTQSNHLEYCGIELKTATTDSGERLTPDYGFILSTEILTRRLNQQRRGLNQSASLYYPKNSASEVILEGNICYFNTQNANKSQISLNPFKEKVSGVITTELGDSKNFKVAYFDAADWKDLSKVADQINADSANNNDVRKETLISKFGDSLGTLLNDYYIDNSNRLSNYDNDYSVNILAVDKLNSIAKITMSDSQGNHIEVLEYADSPWHNTELEVTGLSYFISFYETPPKDAKLEIQTTIKNKLEKIPFRVTFQIPQS